MNSKIPIKIEAVSIENMKFHTQEDLRLIWVIDGTIEVSFIGGGRILEKGDIETVNINEPAKIKGLSNNIALIIHIDKSQCEKWCKDVRTKNFNIGTTAFFDSTYDCKERRRAKIGSLEIKMRKVLKSYMKILNRENNVIVCNEVKDDAYELFDFLLEHYDDVKENLYAIEGIKKNEIERYVQIDSYLIKHMAERISLNNISDFTHLTSSYLSVEIKTKLTKNFSDLLTYYRTVYAVGLLINSDYTNSEIIQKAGFATEKHFYKAIKENLGMSPSGFRKENALQSFYFTLLNEKEIISRVVKQTSLSEDISTNSGSGSPLRKSDHLEIEDELNFQRRAQETNRSNINFIEYMPGVYITQGLECKIYWMKCKSSMQIKYSLEENINIVKGTEIKIMPLENHKEWLEISNLSTDEEGIIIIKD